MSNNNFAWAASVPQNHRDTDSESSFFNTHIESMELHYDGLRIPLQFSNKQIEDIDRLTLACAIAGITSGIRNKQSAGFVVSSAVNAGGNVKHGGKYWDSKVVVSWRNNTKLDHEFTVSDLMNVTFTMAKSVIESAEKYSRKTVTKTVKSKAKTYFDTSVFAEE